MKAKPNPTSALKSDLAERRFIRKNQCAAAWQRRTGFCKNDQGYAGRLDQVLSAAALPRGAVFIDQAAIPRAIRFV